MRGVLKATPLGADVRGVQDLRHRARADESGFGLVESIVAIALILAVLVGSLAMMGASVKGIVSSRQRSVATSLAREALERARAGTYAAAGHDFDSDATLSVAVDPDLSGTPLSFEGRPLVGSTTDQDPASPFYPHQRSEQIGNVTYTTRAYATREVPVDGDPFKRVTVVVEWDLDQYDGAVDDTVRIESTIFDVLEPPDPLLLAEAEIDAGAIRLLDAPTPPVIGGLPVDAATAFLPYARAEVDSRFVQTVRSFARSSRSELRIPSDAGLSSPTPPCTKTAGGGTSSAQCPGAATEAIADNDAGTAPPATSPADTQSDGGGTLARGDGAIVVNLGAVNSASSSATISSTAAGNNDSLPYGKASSSGPAGISVPFDLGAPEGSLARLSSPVTAESSVDREATGAASKVSARAKVTIPAVDLLTFSTFQPTNALDGTALGGYAGMVRADPASVEVTTTSGPSAPGTTTTVSPVVVSMFRTDPVTGLGSYQAVVVTPGQAVDAITEAEFDVGGQRVKVIATLSADARAVEADVVGATTMRSSIRYTGWLTLRLDVTSGPGNQFSYELDYGQVVASTSYEEPT